MQIDKNVVKALASETKLQMLKSLSERRKMPAEISKELQLAPSTITEHLRSLESSGMVRRIETGHKWVYYELTEKSSSIIKPRIPVQSVFMLSAGLLLVFGSLIAFISKGIQFAQKTAPATIQNIETEIASEAGRQMTDQVAVSYDPFMAAILVVGIILIAYGIWKFRKR